MASSPPPSSDLGENDPYKILGIEPGDSFDIIQKAKERKILEVDEDPLSKARIEAAYDSLLMVSLKSRQLGNASQEALNASNREGLNNGTGVSLLTRLKGIGTSVKQDSGTGNLLSLDFPSGQGLVIRIAIGVLAIVLALVSSSDNLEIILSLATIGLFVSQVVAGRRVLQALLWTFLLLSFGLIIGGLLFGGAPIETPLRSSFSGDKLESIPALILLWLGSLLLA